MNKHMTLDEIKAHNSVVQTLKTNRDYATSIKQHLIKAYVDAHMTRHPDGNRQVVVSIAEEAAERFLTNFTR